MENEDTIVALSSPPGRGAIAIIRVSGTQTISILEKLSKKSSSLFVSSPRKLIRTNIYIEDDLLDDGLIAFFPSPYSYTGEDMAEIFTHGNPIISKKIITFLSLKGYARPSLPGEFTRRAFLNEKMDLTRAESIHRIIMARSEYELNAVKRIYFGDLYKLIGKIRSEIMLLKARIEAEVDFSDQDIEYSEKEQLKKEVRNIIFKIQEVLSKSNIAARVSQGFQIALVGKTNAGKSSLLNRILGWDRSIVSEIEGTTRDYISEEIEIAGIPIRIVDTAGLRKTRDIVEKEGIRRSKEAMENSQIILHVIDGSISKYTFLPEVEEILLSRDEKKYQKVIHVINKKDQLHPESWNPESLEQYAKHKVEVCYISCKTAEGIEQLKKMIEKHIQNQVSWKDPFLLEERHHYHFSRIIEALNRILILWDQNAPDEIVAIEINSAIQHIAELTGEITTEDILGRIFSMFCIGK